MMLCSVIMHIIINIYSVAHYYKTSAVFSYTRILIGDSITIPLIGAQLQILGVYHLYIYNYSYGDILMWSKMLVYHLQMVSPKIKFFCIFRTHLLGETSIYVLFHLKIKRSIEL